MKFVRRLFASKKFSLTLGTLATILAAELLGLQISEAAMQKMIMVVGAYVVGQGIADHGKEKAKIEKGSE